MKLKKYSKYKDSGIDWIGDIPEGWQILPIRGLCETGRGRVISNLDIGDNEGKYPVYSSQTSNNGEMGKINTYDFNGEYVTWTTDGANAGTVFYRNEKFNCTNVCGTLKQRPNNKIIMPYLPYVLNQCTKYYVRYDINPKLMNDVMARIRIPVPSIVTQNKISSFLDSKTSQIEKLIEKDKNLIELLKERRVSLINKSLTKGLKKRVMFDTNIYEKFKNLSEIEKGKLLNKIEIISTHIQEDELLDNEKDLLNLSKKIPTDGGIWGTSKWDNFKWGGEEDSKNINSLIGNGKRENHSNDALIANTAKQNNCILITDDKRLIKRSNDIDLKVMSFENLIKDCKMKDSGVEWIGKIPESWEVKKFKFCVSLVNKKAINSNLKKIGLENIESSTGKFIQTKGEFEGDGVHFKKNDVLFGKLRPYLEKVYLSSFEGNAVGDVLVYRQNKLTKSKFIFYRLMSHSYIKIIDGSTYGAKMPRTNSEFIGELPFPVPSINIQEKIIDFLDEGILKIDNHIKKIEERIELYEEYKKSVIYNVVTGKVEV